MEQSECAHSVFLLRSDRDRYPARHFGCACDVDFVSQPAQSVFGPGPDSGKPIQPYATAVVRTGRHRLLHEFRPEDVISRHPGDDLPIARLERLVAHLWSLWPA